MEVTEESGALKEIQELEIQLETNLESARRQAREIANSARNKAAAMVSEKEKELSEARRALAEEGNGAISREKSGRTAGGKLDDDQVRKLADDLLKIIIR